MCIHCFHQNIILISYICFLISNIYLDILIILLCFVTFTIFLNICQHCYQVNHKFLIRIFHHIYFQEFIHKMILQICILSYYHIYCFYYFIYLNFSFYLIRKHFLSFYVSDHLYHFFCCFYSCSINE
jgi:hypothetical protein